MIARGLKQKNERREITKRGISFVIGEGGKLLGYIRERRGLLVWRE